jgi:serine/threonine protein kinase
MMFGLPPFYSKNQHEMYQKTLSQPLSIPGSASPQARDILTRMLQKNRQERIGAKTDFESNQREWRIKKFMKNFMKNFQEIRHHFFFAPIDWEKLNKREIKAPFVPKIRAETDTLNIAREFTDIEPNPGG